MPDRHLDELIAQRERAIARHKAEDAARAKQERRDRELATAWRSAYTDAGLFTDAAAQEITRRLLRLADLMRERFWDFHIAELLVTPGTDHVCLRLLAHACAGNESELPDFIVRARNFFPSAYTVHCDLLEHLLVLSAKGLPYTPPLSMPEIARIVGVTRDKFRGDWRAGRWTTIDAGKKYQRRKRWRCSDPDVQITVLTKIRKNWAEKMWSELN